MKKLILLLLVPFTGLAALGDTESISIGKYGKPVSRQNGENLYHLETMFVVERYDNRGVAVSTMYLKPVKTGPFTADQLTGLRKINIPEPYCSEAHRWTKAETVDADLTGRSTTDGLYIIIYGTIPIGDETFHQVRYVDQVGYNKLETVASSTPTPAPTVEKSDCLLVATENLHRLASTSYWSRILVYQQEINGQPTFGHAVAVWKLSAQGKVYMIDSEGSIELPTQSEDANIIALHIEVFNRQQRGLDIKIPKAWFAE
jgi:hypothetical protein